MALFLRSIQQVPATRRSYSFFSSRSGGGRYFNSAKPPRSVVPTVSKAKADASGSASGDADAGDVSQGATGNGNNNGNNSSQPMKGATEASSISNPIISTHDSSSHPSSASTSSSTHNPHMLPIHPAVNLQDYKLHQFFSLHRPLLLLPQSTSMIFESPQMIPPLSSSQGNSATPEVRSVPPGGLDDPPEASPEADADAARQLVRALVMNRASATTDWEHTLRGLGFDVESEEGRVGLKERLAREWEDVMMDSTKRKRRKKMKRHKLKKRRKATRAQRLKIGR